MTVAVACNLSEGVVLGVDSAVTLSDQQGNISKVFENAEKLFQLGDSPIGVAVYGLASLGERSLGSYLREFEIRDPDSVLKTPSSLKEVTESLRKFLFAAHGTAFPQPSQVEELPPEKRPWFGLVVAGFSPGQYLSEVWEIQIPQHATPNSCVRRKGPGELGSDWFAMYQPILRYLKGFDPVLIDALISYINPKLAKPLSATELDEVGRLLQRFEYQTMYKAMPMEEGVRFVRFLVELVINHHRFTVGAPVVGGKARLGMVTYKGEKFQLLDLDRREGSRR